MVTLINIFMDAFVNNLLFREKKRKKEARKRNFKRKEEKEEKEAEWDARLCV
jgi:hypothetical protein